MGVPVNSGLSACSRPALPATLSTEVSATSSAGRPRPGPRPEPSARPRAATWPPSTAPGRTSSSGSWAGLSGCGWGGGGPAALGGPALTSPGRTAQPGTTITGTEASQITISKMKTAQSSTPRERPGTTTIVLSSPLLLSANRAGSVAQEDPPQAAPSTVVSTGLGTAASVPGIWRTTGITELSGARGTAPGDMADVSGNITDNII